MRPYRSPSPSGSTSGVVLCRPRGGLNDSLCQIWMCFRYARRFQRQLIVDTRHSVLFGLGPRVFGKSAIDSWDPDEAWISELNTLSAEPAELAGRLDSYVAQYDLSSNLVRDKESGVPVTFNPKRAYSAELLVHDQYGGGTGSHRLIRLLSLTPEAKEGIRELVKHSPTDFASVHIRHTDLMSDPERVLSDVAEKEPRRAIHLATDNARVIEMAYAILGANRVFSLPPVPETPPGQPLHWMRKHPDNEARFGILVHALADLWLMANSSRLYLSSAKPRHGDKPVYSGFGQLGSFLAKNPRVAAHLFGTATSSQRSHRAKVVTLG